MRGLGGHGGRRARRRIGVVAPGPRGCHLLRGRPASGRRALLAPKFKNAPRARARWGTVPCVRPPTPPPTPSPPRASAPGERAPARQARRRARSAPPLAASAVPPSPLPLRASARARPRARARAPACPYDIQPTGCGGRGAGWRCASRARARGTAPRPAEVKTKTKTAVRGIGLPLAGWWATMKRAPARCAPRIESNNRLDDAPVNDPHTAHLEPKRTGCGPTKLRNGSGPFVVRKKKKKRRRPPARPASPRPTNPARPGPSAWRRALPRRSRPGNDPSRSRCAVSFRPPERWVPGGADLDPDPGPHPNARVCVCVFCLRRRVRWGRREPVRCGRRRPAARRPPVDPQAGRQAAGR